MSENKYIAIQFYRDDKLVESLIVSRAVFHNEHIETLGRRYALKDYETILVDGEIFYENPSVLHLKNLENKILTETRRADYYENEYKQTNDYMLELSRRNRSLLDNISSVEDILTELTSQDTKIPRHFDSTLIDKDLKETYVLAKRSLEYTTDLQDEIFMLKRQLNTTDQENEDSNKSIKKLKKALAFSVFLFVLSGAYIYISQFTDLLGKLPW